VGLPGEGQSQLEVPLGNDQGDTTIAAIIPVDAYAPEAPLQRYPTRSCRSAVENQPCDQDNISTQLLIKKGKMSSRKKTKHIKAKFFFIKDRIDDGEIRVLDCPAEEMWADIMTKLLQGTAIRVMQAEFMNSPVNYEDPEVMTVAWKSEVAAPFKAPQECVGRTAFRQISRG
jgi:hypothetical protein